MPLSLLVKKYSLSQVLWHISIVPTLGKLGLEDCMNPVPAWATPETSIKTTTKSTGY
jgi:hypothetical protein